MVEKTILVDEVDHLLDEVDSGADLIASYYEDVTRSLREYENTEDGD